MKSSQQNRVRLSIEALERRDVPGTLMFSSPGWGPEPPPSMKEITGSARPGLLTAEAHSHARPFHLEESGAAVINTDGTINASASGHATHLGAFTLHDTSTIVGVDVTPDGVLLHVVGQAHLEAANGDHLCASFTGTINMTAGTGTLNFQWTGGSGRFADATGATVWRVSLNPDLTYTAVADGVINY